MWPGAAIFAPTAPAPHVCTTGPTWSAITLPTSDVYLGVAQANGVWIATGKGQAGVTPSNSIRSSAPGTTWSAGGTMPNQSNLNPQFLRAGAHNGWAIAWAGAGNAWVTRDQGVTWSTFLTGVNFGCYCIESGNGRFVYLDNAAAFTYSSASGAAVVANATPAKLARCWWIPSRGLWLGLENGGTRSWTSPDLVTWTAGPTMPFDSATVGPYGISQNGSNIVIVYSDATSTHAAYSNDAGLTFNTSAAFAGGASQSYAVAHGNGIVVCTIALGGHTQYSTDGGATWAAGGSLTMAKTWIIAFDSVAGWFAIGGTISADTVGNAGAC